MAHRVFAVRERDGEFVQTVAGRAPIIVVYVASITGGVLAVDEESLEARTFTPREIPWDELAFRSTYEALRDYVDGRWTRRVDGR